MRMIFVYKIENFLVVALTHFGGFATVVPISFHWENIQNLGQIVVACYGCIPDIGSIYIVISSWGSGVVMAC